ncbi:MAG TPA: hypothetical protein VFQ91_20470 [Bryobacteraceae bacterium]|nr:hypothetical protein [Bryobacteraceae bacterium]
MSSSLSRWVVYALMLLPGCTAKYTILPEAPHYLLRSPDGTSRPFPDTAAAFSDSLEGWVDLQPGMVLRVERAYFDLPESRLVRDFAGLESMQLQVDSSSGVLREIAFQPLANRPVGQASVRAAIPENARKQPNHRFFFQVVLDKSSGSARAALVSGSSVENIAANGARLLRGERCEGELPQGGMCTAIPDGAAASLLFQVVANGKPTLTLWGSSAAHLAGKRPVQRFLRPYRGRLRRVRFDPRDPVALRLPLLPGDVLDF